MSKKLCKSDNAAKAGSKSKSHYKCAKCGLSAKKDHLLCKPTEI